MAIPVRTRITKLPNSRENQIEFAVGFEVVPPEVDLHQVDTEKLIILEDCSPTRLRLAAAKHFLDLLEKHAHHQALATFYFDAFCSSARSVTLVLQKEASTFAGFAEWYAEWQNSLRDDALASFFVKLRNESEKERPQMPAVTFACELRHHLDGTVSTESHCLRLSLDGKMLADDVIAACRQYLARLTEGVRSAQERGFVHAPTQSLPRLEPRFMRETPAGTWMPFEPPHWEPRPDEFPSRAAHDAWKRRVKKATGEWR